MLQLFVRANYSRSKFTIQLGKKTMQLAKKPCSWEAMVNFINLYSATTNFKTLQQQKV